MTPADPALPIADPSWDSTVAAASIFPARLAKQDLGGAITAAELATIAAHMNAVLARACGMIRRDT